MKTFSTLAMILLLLLSRSAFSQNQFPRQDQSVMRDAVEQFLRVQTTGLPGNVEITVNSFDPRLSLAACAEPQAFLPNGARAWGKTSVGLRCTAPSNWTVYVGATVRVYADFVAAAAPLKQGQTIGPADLARMTGDLTTLPAGVVTDPVQAIGRTVAGSLAAGAPLRIDQLRTQTVVQQGQTVRLVSSGPGFRVTSEGRALGNGSAGQTVLVRAQNGQSISGIARLGGIVEVPY